MLYTSKCLGQLVQLQCQQQSRCWWDGILNVKSEVPICSPSWFKPPPDCNRIVYCKLDKPYLTSPNAGYYGETYSLSHVQKKPCKCIYQCFEVFYSTWRNHFLCFSSDHRHVKACTEPNIAKDKSYNDIMAISIPFKSSFNIRQTASVWQIIIIWEVLHKPEI